MFLIRGWLVGGYSTPFPPAMCQARNMPPQGNNDVQCSTTQYCQYAIFSSTKIGPGDFQLDLLCIWICTCQRLKLYSVLWLFGSTLDTCTRGDGVSAFYRTCDGFCTIVV